MWFVLLNVLINFFHCSATAVDRKISVAMRDLISQLTTMVDGYECKFDVTHLESYKHGLYEFMDERLGEELGRVGGDTLGGAYEAARRKLIGEGALADNRLCTSSLLPLCPSSPPSHN